MSLIFLLLYHIKYKIMQNKKCFEKLFEFRLEKIENKKRLLEVCLNYTYKYSSQRTYTF